MASGMGPEQLSALQGIVNPGDRIITAVEAGLVQEWIRTNRVVALVEHGSEQAVFVFVTCKTPFLVSTDLTIEQILPIDCDFRCELDTSSSEIVSTDIFVKISRHRVKLLFEMLPGYRANKFVDEVVKATEAAGKRRDPPPDFAWIKPYHKIIDPELNAATPSDTSLESQPEETCKDLTADDITRKPAVDLDGSDVALPRTSIASGTTSIAARETVVRHQMAIREEAYTDIRKFKVFAGTFNVNGQAPTLGLADWLSADEDPPDIYAVGFQELDLSKEAFLFNETPREEEWLRAVLTALHPKAKYRKIRLIRLVGMMLIVFVQERHAAYVRGVASEVVGTGLMGKMGNKGGVAVRLELHSTSMCFVNSHLAAHLEEVERRNQDYHDICSRLTFSASIPAKSIKDHDQVFWLGDLNYRLNDVDATDSKLLLEKQDYSQLLKYDQLKQQMAAKRIFAGFHEGPIKFKPTYKYDPGTDNWDSSEKNRAPAWCDRVLWKGEGIVLDKYRSHPSVMLSDHKPVSVLFEIDVKVIDTVRYRRIYEDVMKKLDKLENEFLPQVAVDTTEISVEVVKFLEPKARSLTIANTGQVPVQFEFVKKPKDDSYCKAWLTIDPCNGFIMPGEKCDVTLEVCVDKKTAHSLNSGRDQLYDILVLHLEGGKDIFITVSGEYERSCFGCSLEALVHMHSPVRAISPGQLAALEKSAYQSTSELEVDSLQATLAVPKELWFLIDEIYRRGMTVSGLFEQPGVTTEIWHIRDALDTTMPEELPGSIHSVAEALLIFLEALPEAIIPSWLTNKALDASPSFPLCKTIIPLLPTSHQHVFRHLCAFLREVLHHNSKNGLDAKTLAAVFSGAFMRDPPKPPESNGPMKNRVVPSQQSVDRKKSTFLYHFLVNDLDD